MIRGDDPITKRDEDVLGRDRVARVIAGEIRSLDATKGAVVGVLGPWGSGKTSIINLLRVELAEPPAITVLDFNPWMFSGADQLVESFFTELAAQLRMGPGKLKGVADAPQAYGEVVAPLRFLPVLGPWIERFRGATKAMKAVYDLRKRGVAAGRSELTTKLEDLDAPIIVVIDDIDRLRTSEIRDIFKLVRLTASFPNVVYILAFDRARVEAALEEDGLPGRDYLEKIVQVIYDIPAIPEHALIGQVTSAIDEALDGIENLGPIDMQRWPDVFAEVIFPLVRNMRDVRRYAASLRGTVIALHGRVELVDALALDAIRVFLPDVFANLPSAAGALTGTESDYSYTGRADPLMKTKVESFIAAGGGKSSVVRDAVERLFPAALRYIANNHYGSDWLKIWLKERRVAHHDILSFYLEGVAGETLESSWMAEQAFEKLTDAVALDDFMRSLPSDYQVEVINALEAFEDDFPQDAVVPASTVLLNLHQDLSNKPRGMFGFGNDMAVRRLVLRLLRRLATPADTEAAVKEILPGVSRLSDRVLLVTLIGYRKGAGQKLIPEAGAAALERSLRDEIRSATTQQLAADPQSFAAIGWMLRTASANEPGFNLAPDPELSLVLLKGAQNEVRSQPMGSRAVSRETHLYWDGLVEVFGGLPELRNAVESVASTVGEDEDSRAVVELAHKYLTGWRPRGLPSMAGDGNGDETSAQSDEESDEPGAVDEVGDSD
jgi:predicted KAP-like P-loop ATPase